MRTGRAMLLASVLILSGILLLGRWAKKSITLVIDGKSASYTTFTPTVGGFLRSARIPMVVEDEVYPLPEHWLRDGDQIVIQRAALFVVHTGNLTYRLISDDRLPANVLKLANQKLFPGDRVLFENQEVPADQELPERPVYSLQYLPATPVTIRVGLKRENISSAAPTLGQALWEAGIRIKARDRVSLPLDTPLDRPLDVRLRPSREIKIETSRGIHKTRTSAVNVGEALAEAAIPLQGLDFSIPGSNDPIPVDGNIRVIRVADETSLESSPLPFETETQPVADLELDQQSTVQEGIPGLKVRRVRIRKEDGVEVGRIVEAEYVAQQPQARILGYGTMVVPHTLESPDGPIKYWRALNMYAVSYNHTSNGGTGTASGIPLEKGVAAIDLNYIPFGTRMYIPGYGIAVAADVGGGVKGRMIDLGYSDFDYVSWHQWVTVYFLWPPPETVPWIIP